MTRPPTDHEHHLTSEIQAYRTDISELEWTIPDNLADAGAPGGHGGLGSTRFHNELRDIITSAESMDAFVAGVEGLANRWGIPAAQLPLSLIHI